MMRLAFGKGLHPLELTFVNASGIHIKNNIDKFYRIQTFVTYFWIAKQILTSDNHFFEDENNQQHPAIA